MISRVLPKPPQKPYILPNKRENVMTIVAGFRCSDGIIICADQQVTSPGFHKYHETKISRETDLHFASLVFAYSGLPGLAREAQEKMMKAIDPHRAKITNDLVAGIADEVLTGMGRQYADVQLSMLIGVCLFLEEPQLFKFDGKSLHTADNVNLLGVGDSSLTRFLFDKMYSPIISLENGKNLAVYVIKEAEQYIDGCGGQIDVAVMENHLGSVEYLPQIEVEQRIRHMKTYEASLRERIIMGDFSLPT